MYINSYGQMINTYNDLVHYGTLGMKWGIRRYQPYPGDYHGDGKFIGKRKKPRWERTYEKSGYDANSRKTARQATKRLNDLDQARAETERNYNIAKSKGQILKADAYKKDVESINKEIDRTIKKLNKGDMHVSSEDIKRNAAQGKALVAEVFGGYLGKAIYKTVTGTWKKDAEGKKYKVDTEEDWFKKANEKEKSQYVEKRSNEMRKEEASRNTSNKINGHEIDENLRKISLNPLASLSASYSVNAATNTAIAELHARNKYEKQAGDMSALSKSDRKYLNKQINTLAKADVDLQMALLKQEYIRDIGATTSYADDVVDRATTKYNEAKSALNSSIKTLKSANASSKAASKSTQNASNGMSKEQINNKMETARKNDRWDLNFMEAVQNKTWAGANEEGKVNKNKMLSEYKDYLSDPDGYWKGRGNRNASDNVETGRKLYNMSDSRREKAFSDARKQSVQNYSRVKSMRNSGMTYTQIADKLGVSESTVWAMLFDEE